jgi:hypothetical protein
VLVAGVADQFSQAPVRPLELGPRGTEPPTRLPNEPREKQQVGALRDHVISSQGRSYRIYRGDITATPISH